MATAAIVTLTAGFIDACGLKERLVQIKQDSTGLPWLYQISVEEQELGDPAQDAFKLTVLEGAYALQQYKFRSGEWRLTSIEVL